MVSDLCLYPDISMLLYVDLSIFHWGGKSFYLKIEVNFECVSKGLIIFLTKKSGKPFH